MLSRDEIDTCRREGDVIPRGFRLSEAELAPLREAVQVDDPDVLPDRFLNAHLDGGDPCGIRARKALDDIARDRRILDFAESVTGPDPLLFTHLFCEPPASARVVPWDQDGPFWPVRALRSCTVWLAIDPARSRPDAAADWSGMPVELVRGVNRNPLTDLAAGDFGRPW